MFSTNQEHLLRQQSCGKHPTQGRMQLQQQRRIVKGRLNRILEAPNEADSDIYCVRMRHPKTVGSFCEGQRPPKFHDRTGVAMYAPNYPAKRTTKALAQRLSQVQGSLVYRSLLWNTSIDVARRLPLPTKSLNVRLASHCNVDTDKSGP